MGSIILKQNVMQDRPWGEQTLHNPHSYHSLDNKQLELDIVHPLGD